MCVCVRMCVYIYIYIYTHTYMHAYIHACMHTYIFTYICIICIYIVGGGHDGAGRAAPQGGQEAC